ncbi:FHA domain-containing protein [Abeliophyllum distichum]|uniref:FHA domain-containing protein n=1 Tax=Abeliophyllum distichum TaxID=126358 RepID=A0ABD1U0P5_9LAMI
MRRSDSEFPARGLGGLLVGGVPLEGTRLLLSTQRGISSQRERSPSKHTTRSSSRRKRSPAEHRSSNAQRPSTRNRSSQRASSQSPVSRSPMKERASTRTKSPRPRQSLSPLSRSPIRQKPSSRTRPLNHAASRSPPPLSPIKEKPSYTEPGPLVERRRGLLCLNWQRGENSQAQPGQVLPRLIHLHHGLKGLRELKLNEMLKKGVGWNMRKTMVGRVTGLHIRNRILRGKCRLKEKIEDQEGMQPTMGLLDQDATLSFTA